MAIVCASMRKLVHIALAILTPVNLLILIFRLRKELQDGIYAYGPNLLVILFS